MTSVEQAREKSNRPSLSVIISCTEGSPNLPRCIQSIIGQTRRPDEVLVVDRTSGEMSASIISQFQGTFKIRSVEIDGPPTLMKIAELACGDVFCWVESADWLSPHYLEDGLDTFTTSPRTAIVYSDVHYENDAVAVRSFPESTESGDISALNFIHPGSLIRKDALGILNASRSSSPSYIDSEWKIWRQLIRAGFIGVKQNSPYFFGQKPDGTFRHDRSIHAKCSYFRMADLAHEEVTLFTPLSGCRDLWESYCRFLDNQTWNHKLISLILLDTGQNPEFSQLVRQWMLASDYENVTYKRAPVGDQGLVDLQRKPGQLSARRYAEAMSRLYNIARELVQTDYLWILYDSILPPLDTCEELLRSFCPDTVSVSASHAALPLDDSTTPDNNQVSVRLEAGTEVPGSTRFGCTLLRAFKFKEAPFGISLELGCEREFFDRLNDYQIAKVNWSLEAEQLSPPQGTEPDRATPLIDEDAFDEKYYLDTNPDVRKGIEEGVIVSGFNHFMRTGLEEGRVYRVKNPQEEVQTVIKADQFDEDFYLNTNPDVKNGVAQGLFASGYEHFIERGIKEGRTYRHKGSDTETEIFIAEESFDEEFYLQINPDVKAGISGGLFLSGYEHFIERGIKEGRSYRRCDS